jgi:hypothetical protein
MVTRLHLPAWLGYVAAFTEFFGGMLLIVGLLTRVAALMTAIDMAVAILKIHLHGGLMGPNSFAFPLALFAIALMLVFTGCGWLGLDDFAGKSLRLPGFPAAWHWLRGRGTKPIRVSTPIAKLLTPIRHLRCVRYGTPQRQTHKPSAKVASPPTSIRLLRS